MLEQGFQHWRKLTLKLFCLLPSHLSPQNRKDADREARCLRKDCDREHSKEYESTASDVAELSGMRSEKQLWMWHGQSQVTFTRGGSSSSLKDIKETVTAGRAQGRN